jgi:hypothetical protein
VAAADFGAAAGNPHRSGGEESISSDDHAGDPGQATTQPPHFDATPMTRQASRRSSKRLALRLRLIRRRAAAWRKRTRRAMTLALATAGMALMPSIGLAQTGQTAMAPAGGIVNRAATGFRDLNENGPGIFYYGINAADRGLGYRGSYMTLGGFVPLAEDDLGGFWATDLRGHLSEYGGFFSNVGAVRKQFIGGTLLGVGVYWDYDGDMNQYPDTVIPGVSTSYTFPGGQTYNQVGVSGEWLTDYGNLRSNGYIPVGSTAQLLGPFVGNSILCVNGINAALGGADLEVGAYIPGLADWAGMISVGGYALGNTAYQFPGGADAVPWFGGVYTRLDMTFVENWDFSLQYNNDSYFESTGFARLSYRMGGSRRRNVPDQAEQPMMRNEHIVRAYQAPVEATNPNNLDAAGNPLPWRVYHVDNSAAGGGNGTAEAPFQTLTAAEAAAGSAFDIVYVHVGNSLTNPYITPLAGYSFAANNQYLVGEGTTLRIPTVTCGLKSLQFSDTPNLYPVVTNPAGTAINVDQPGTRVAHLRVSSSNVAIADGAGFAAPGKALVSDVIIAGSNGPLQRGVEIANSTGSFLFDNVRLSNLGNDGFVVSAAGGDVSIRKSSLTNVTGDGVRASGAGAEVTITKTSFTNTRGRAIVASGANATINVGNSTITATTGLPGHAVVASGAGSTITLAGTRITDTLGSALVASGSDATIVASASAITGTGNPAILITGTDAGVTLDASKVSTVKGDGVLVDAAKATFVMQNASVIDSVTGNGISVQNADASAFVLGSSRIENTGANGILSGDGLSPAGADGGSLLVRDSTIRNVESAAIRAFGVAGPSAAGPERIVAVQGSTIGNALLGGIVTSNSNLRVERLDNTDPTSRQTTISSTGPLGIQATANTVVPGALPPGAPYLYRVLVENTRITGSTQGIVVAAGPDVANPPPVAGNPPAPGEQYPTVSVPTIEFTATNNQITTTGGRGITVSAVFDPFNGTGFFPPGRPLSRVNASIVLNTITAPGFDIQLNGGPTQFFVFPFGNLFAPNEQLPISVDALSAADLGDINNGATVGIPINTDINYDPTLVVPPPPPAPIPPP